MLQEIFENQKKQIDYFFDHFSIPAMESFLEQICLGQTLFLTGVGKSGWIARKIAATLVSLEIKASFLSPLDALHGDLGALQAQDSVLFFSKSGETKELLDLLPSIRAKKGTILSVTSSNGSSLMEKADASFYLPMEKEICPFHLVPTTSTEVQLLFGDLLTIALMEKKGISAQQYALNHPGGQLGEKSRVRVCDVMIEKKDLPLCQLEETLGGVLEAFSDRRCGCVVVTDCNMCLKGIFTDGDLRRSMQKGGAAILKRPLKELMTQFPKAIDPKALLAEALQLMEKDPKTPITVLPVVDEEQKVLGMIKLHDILQKTL